MKAVQRRAEGSNLTFSQKKGENDRKLQFSEHIHEKIYFFFTEPSLAQKNLIVKACSINSNY